VLAANLSYVGDGFQVTVCDEEQFAVQRDCLLNAGTRRLGSDVDEATDEEITEWAEENDTLVATLDEKISRLPTITDEQERWEFRNRVVKWYLEGQDILEALRRHPEAHEAVLKAKSHRENYLVKICSLRRGTPSDMFDEALNGYMATVIKQAYMLAEHTVESLAYEAVADWMLRCPLNFPKVV
jgi:hypothetical protein